MKRTSILLLTFLSLLIIGCSDPDTTQERKVIVTGYTKGDNNKQVWLSNHPIPLQNEWSVTPDTSGFSTPIDSSKKFRFEIQIKEPHIYRLSFANTTIPLFLQPKDSVHVILDSIPKVTGSNTLLNQYLSNQEKDLIQSAMYIENNAAELYRLDQIGFENTIDSLQNSSLKGFTKLASIVKNIPAEFKKQSLASINYQYMYYQLFYPSLHKTVTGKKAGLSSDFFAKVSAKINEPSLLNNKKYVTYLDKYTEIMSTDTLKDSNYNHLPLEKIQARYFTIKDMPIDQQIKEYLLKQHFNLCNENYSAKHWKNILDDFTENHQNESFSNKIVDMHQRSFDKRKQPDRIETYKKTGDISLDAHIFFPEHYHPNGKRSAYLYFHGGGWSLGMPEAGYNACKKITDKGMVAISFEYRLIDVHGNEIQRSLEDAKSAVRWVRSKASDLGIDPNKIVVAGFSAGAHLAASTAIIDDFVSEDNQGFSSKPNLVITQSSSYDLTKDHWFDGVSNGNSKSISLTHNVTSGLPPFLSFHTTEDHLAPIYEFFQFQEVMIAYKNEIQFRVFDHVGHFFGDQKARETAEELTEKFLIEKGFINIDQNN